MLRDALRQSLVFVDTVSKRCYALIKGLETAEADKLVLRDLTLQILLACTFERCDESLVAIE